MFAVRSIVRSAAFTNGTKRLYHQAVDHKPASMNELPIPCGSWQKHYDAKQSKYNAHLMIGVIFTGVTLVVAKASGLIYLNFSPPKLD